MNGLPPGAQSAELTPRVFERFDALGETDWEGLDHDCNPFLTPAFLGELEATGSIGPASGWHPHHLALYESNRLVAFAPTYRKWNSRGEFVFDWSWADAYHRHGLSYYPKLLTAVPWTPVSGPRLLTQRDHPDRPALRRRLVDLALAECRRLGLSSWHCNFVRATDRDALQHRELLQRRDWQFHWQNRGYADFDAFLADLRSRKRKNIRRERRRVSEGGFRFQWQAGDDLDAADLAFVHRCYTDTFHNYGQQPALTPGFFEAIAARLGAALQVVFARRNGRRVAMALFLNGGGRLYGRYWGAVESYPELHFEMAYYQGVEHCIRNGIEVFESGAQGEHKIARGFLPSQTHSAHFIAEPMFRKAIAAYLRQEDAWLEDYREQLAAHEPFRRGPG